MSDVHSTAETVSTETTETQTAQTTEAPKETQSAETTAEETTETTVEEFVPFTAETLVIPEGMEVDEPTRDQFLGLANEYKLPKEAVGKLVELQAGLAKQASERASEAWEQLQETWREDAKKDPQIGGDKLDGVLSSVGRVIDEYAKGLSKEEGDAFRQAMDLTGAGNHPAVIKFVHSMAKQLDEGGPVSGRSATQSANVAELLYNHPTSRN